MTGEICHWQVMTKLWRSLHFHTKVAVMTKQVFFQFSRQILILYSLFKGLSGLNTKKFEPKTCSQRKCYYSENIIQSIWISSQVNLNHMNPGTSLGGWGLGNRACQYIQAPSYLFAS